MPRSPFNIQSCWFWSSFRYWSLHVNDANKNSPLLWRVYCYILPLKTECSFPRPLFSRQFLANEHSFPLNPLTVPISKIGNYVEKKRANLSEFSTTPPTPFLEVHFPPHRARKRLKCWKYTWGWGWDIAVIIWSIHNFLIKKMFSLEFNLFLPVSEYFLAEL